MRSRWSEGRAPNQLTFKLKSKGLKLTSVKGISQTRERQVQRPHLRKGRPHLEQTWLQYSM